MRAWPRLVIYAAPPTDRLWFWRSFAKGAQSVESRRRVVLAATVGGGSGVLALPVDPGGTHVQPLIGQDQVGPVARFNVAEFPVEPEELRRV